MGGGSMKSNPTKARKRVEATETEENSLSMSTAPPLSLVRGKDGSAFARCDECNKDVPVALITMHSCSLDAKIKLNLKAQVVERPPEVKKKPPTETQRKKFTTATSQPKMSKRAKKDKDPNAPKRPLTAFFLFLDDFRKSYKEANPDSKGVKMVTKEGGEKWKSMTDEEKKPYVDKAAELKQEYKRALESDIAGDGDGGTADGVLEKEASEKEGEEEISDGDEE
ncbi:high mobility group B protein 7-like [Malus sylvestris]|uniref:high mobility group B protein 7-like n=1 Tax=Malus sylvestris TaxID=3752 RepID=UPI0021ABB408|nr:high mobility group B protein 7-like [Malus sylvestris]